MNTPNDASQQVPTPVTPPAPANRFQGERFVLPARILHWLMAILILAMLYVGAGMVSTASARYPQLLAWHRPLGIAVLILALLRLGVRLTHRPPPLPGDLPVLQAVAAKASHYVLYALMIAMPLIGWAMLSAGGYPIVLLWGIHLPPIAPVSAPLHALLWTAHQYLALAFFALILLHLAAGLFHTLIRRDGVFESMTSGSAGREP